jgi:hypothetical protein
MGDVHKMDLMQLIRKANKEQELYEDFELEVYDTVYKLRISMPDIFDILEEQQLAKAAAYAKCRAQGLDEYAIDEDKWNKQLSVIKDKDIRKNMETRKPLNYAQQESEEIARLTTVRTLLPKIIKYSETGELLCKGSADREQFGKYMANNSKALNVITEVWAKIMVRYSEVQETVKNSSKESKETSSDSK